MLAQPCAGITTDGYVKHSLGRIDKVGHRNSCRIGRGCILGRDDRIHCGNF
ncbi:hypothetical protein MGAST_22140 [Mycobacterium gastri 'Wayne']|nr:hypothetical protein MGAST_22140 [Mycobacterium gastri 'Wayne']